MAQIPCSLAGVTLCRIAPSGPGCRASLVALDPKHPTQLGRHQVLRVIAAGGMATVYLGRRLEDDGSRLAVALKVMKDDLGQDDEYVDMFRDEAAILLRLTHPNIVETFEADVTGGHRWIAMELLLGRTVADLCDECERRGTHVPHVLSAWICARVADGLHYAHELKDPDGARLSVIHRDANPSNIILTYDGRVKLIDFGLAKAARRATRSREGVLKGKVPYLSPEQVKQREIDHRTDLYALGCTLWEMTTGRRLWKRDTDLETVRAIQDGVVPDPTELVEGYPEELWAIVWEALMPQSEHRYKDAKSMAADLDTFVRRTQGAEGMPQRAEAFVEEIFPEERRRREAWIERLGMQGPA
jgi:eukaryotic-like serine/threonine-protein kinase